DLPGFLVELAEGDTRGDERQILVDLLQRSAIEALLYIVHGKVTADPGAREIGAIAIGPDHIRVDGDHVALAADIVGAFAVPGVRPRSCLQQPGLDPLAA